MTAQGRPPDGPKKLKDGSSKPRGAAEKARKGTLFDKVAVGLLRRWGAVSFLKRRPNTAPRDAQDGPQTPRAPPDRAPVAPPRGRPRQLPSTPGSARALPDGPNTPQDGPRGSQVAANKALRGPIVRRVCPGFALVLGRTEHLRRPKRAPGGSEEGPVTLVVRQVCRGFAAVPRFLKLSQGPKRAAREPQDTPNTASRLQGPLTAQGRPPKGPKEPKDVSRKLWRAADKIQKGTLFDQFAVGGPPCWGA